MFSSVGRAGVPCIEALSSLQQTRVRLLNWGPLLCVTPPRSHPVSCRLFSYSVNKGMKGQKKKKKIKKWIWMCCHPVQVNVIGHWVTADTKENFSRILDRVSPWLCIYNYQIYRGLFLEISDKLPSRKESKKHFLCHKYVCNLCKIWFDPKKWCDYFYATHGNICFKSKTKQILNQSHDVHHIRPSGVIRRSESGVFHSGRHCVPMGEFAFTQVEQHCEM